MTLNGCTSLFDNDLDAVAEPLDGPQSALGPERMSSDHDQADKPLTYVDAGGVPVGLSSFG